MADTDRFADAVELLNLRVSDLQKTIADEAEASRQAIPGAFKAAVTDQETMGVFWATAFKSLQTSAQKHTTNIIWSGLKSLMNKTFLFVCLGLFVYSIGGWSALVKLWSSIWSSHP